MTWTNTRHICTIPERPQRSPCSSNNHMFASDIVFPIGQRSLIRLFVGRYALGQVPSSRAQEQCPRWKHRCAFSLGKYSSGPAAAPQNVVITTLFCSGRRPRFSCKFLGAAPHTPFGNYNVILTGGGESKCRGMQEECGAEGSKEKTLLALYPWTLPKWGSLLVSLRPSQGLDFAKALCSQSLGIRLACTRRAKRKVRSSTSNLPACFNRRRRLRSCMAVPRPTNFLF